MKSLMKTIWTDIVQNKEIIVILTIAWIILFEQISLFVIITGLVASFLVTEFTDRFLLKENYEHSYVIGFGTLIKYVGRLIYEIYVAGFSVIPAIFTGKADVQIIRVKTKLQDELLIDLVANAITLTPGSVTLNKKGRNLYVLALNPDIPEDGEPDLIPEVIENILYDYENKIDGKA